MTIFPALGVMSLIYRRYMFSHFRHGWRGLFCGLLLIAIAQSSCAETRILASIKPLALIAQEIAGPEIPVDTLLPISASPHDYPLKVSDYRHLGDAALVLWVGAELESFLDKPLRNLPPGKSIQVFDLPGIEWPDERLPTGPEFHHDHRFQESGGHHGKDPHLWLDPHNAVAIARIITSRLKELQPEHAILFSDRFAIFAQEMAELDVTLRAQMEPLKSKGFAVYHEGYAHFVHRYGLNQLGYVTYLPERRPGAKHLYQLRQRLGDEGVCLFAEPYQKNDSLQAMAKELNLRLGLLDPIGDNQVKSYRELMEQMGQAFSACLANR